jgi:hypothetical protein
MDAIVNNKNNIFIFIVFISFRVFDVSLSSASRGYAWFASAPPFDDDWAFAYVVGVFVCYRYRPGCRRSSQTAGEIYRDQIYLGCP